MKVILPDGCASEIKRQLAQRPPVILSEDRREFIRSVAEHQPDAEVSAETHWNNMLEINEAEHRRQRQQDGAAPTRTPYFLTVDQIATRWNMSARTVWRMVRDGRLPSRLIGSSRRVLEEDVERFEMADMAVA